MVTWLQTCKGNIALNTPKTFGKPKDKKELMKSRPIMNKRAAFICVLESFLKEVYTQLLSSSDLAIS